MTTPTKVSSPIAAEAANDKENAKVDDNTANTTTTTTPKGPPSAIEFEPPLACVRRILKNSLPSSTNVGKDASAAFARASGIFIIYLTACANDFARENRRQTITANDVLAALKELEFDEFTPQLTEFLERYRVAEKSKKEAKAKAKEEAMEEEEDEEDEDDNDGQKDNVNNTPQSAKSKEEEETGADASMDMGANEGDDQTEEDERDEDGNGDEEDAEEMEE